MLNHRRHSGIRQTEVFQINDLARGKIETGLRITDVVCYDFVVHTGLRQIDDLHERGVCLNVRRQSICWFGTALRVWRRRILLRVD